MVGIIGKLRKFNLNLWLAAVAGAILILVIVQVVRYAGAGKLGEELVRASLSQEDSPGRSDVKELEKYQAVVEKGLFGKKEPPPGIPKLFGILGEFALLGNSANDAKRYEVGAQLPGNAKLVEIHLNSVVLEKDGKKQTITLFPELGAKTEPPPGPPGPGRAPEDRRPERPPEAGAAVEGGVPETHQETPPDEEEARARMREESTRSGSRRPRGMGSRRPVPNESE